MQTIQYIPLHGSRKLGDGSDTEMQMAVAVSLNMSNVFPQDSPRCLVYCCNWEYSKEY